MLNVNGNVNDGNITLPGYGSIALKGSAFLDDTVNDGSSFGAIIRSAASNTSIAAGALASFVHDNTYAGAIAGFKYTPSGPGPEPYVTYGYRAGLNLIAPYGGVINFRIAYPSLLSVGNVNANGLEITGSIAATTGITGSVSYVPAVAADWNNNPPKTVQEALDRIAAALGPIT